MFFPCILKTPTFQFFCLIFFCIHFPILMDNTNRLRSLRSCKQTKFTRHDSEEVTSKEWEFINMTEQEEDLIFRMYELVGDRWELIAGRVPGREAKDIERYWIMRNCDYFSHKRRQLHKSSRFPNSSP